jgi:ankyrin repeat protein
MEWLLDAGATCDLLSKWRRTPLMVCAEKGQLQAAALLLRRGAMESINHVDRDGNTALHYATLGADASFVELLLACGEKSSPPVLCKSSSHSSYTEDASTVMRNAAGLLPEELATSRGRPAVANLLRLHKPDLFEPKYRMDFMVERYLNKTAGDAEDDENSASDED